MPKNAKNEEIPEVKKTVAPEGAQGGISPDTIVFKTASIKFKKPNRTSIILDFEKSMGFRPRRIFIKMDETRNNAFIVGIVDDDRVSDYAKQIDAEKAASNKQEKKLKKAKKK